MNQQIKVFANCCISYIVTFLIFVLTLLLSSRTSVFLFFCFFIFIILKALLFHRQNRALHGIMQLNSRQLSMLHFY